MNQLVRECFTYKIFVKKPSASHKKWFKNIYDFDYPTDYDNIDPKLAKELQKTIKMKKKDAEFEKRMAQQRSKRGYGDNDVWSIDWWFIRTCKPMLMQLVKIHHGFPVRLEMDWLNEHPELNMTLDEFMCWPRDEESEGYKLRERASEECDQRWVDILNRLIFLLNEMDEDKCTMKNPYEKEWNSYYRKFEKKYPDRGNELKTEKELEMEKTSNVWLHVGPERDPDFGDAFKEASKNYFEFEKQISQYRDKCKDEFFELFSKYFWNLGD